MLTSTKNTDMHTMDMLVYGPAGSGKTRLAATLNKPLIISAEAGLLSLREYDLPVYEVKGMADMNGAYEEALKGDYEWIVIDSLSELSENCLTEAKASNNDGRQAYQEMADKMISMIRDFRDMPKNVYMTAKQDKVKDEITGAILFGPMTEGQRLAKALPYLFDEVFVLHNYKNDDGEIDRSLQTERDNQYDAKDRSGALDFWEPADLGKIQAKILGA